MSRRPDHGKGANAAILKYLRHTKPEGACGLEIAVHRGFAPSTVYAALRRLERDGFVEVVDGPGVCRVYRLSR